MSWRCSAADKTSVSGQVVTCCTTQERQGLLHHTHNVTVGGEALGELDFVTSSFCRPHRCGRPAALCHCAWHQAEIYEVADEQTAGRMAVACLNEKEFEWEQLQCLVPKTTDEAI